MKKNSYEKFLLEKGKTLNQHIQHRQLHNPKESNYNKISYGKNFYESFYLEK